MNPATAARAATLGAICGMRSFSGPAVLSLRLEHPAARFLPVLAAGEMIADKTPFVPDRIEPLPLAGRAFTGALTGALLARQEGGSAVLGGFIGAAAAVALAHIAYRARKRAPIGSVMGGLIEDGLVIAAGVALLQGD
jgi:uncharacterized membrane protein